MTEHLIFQTSNLQTVFKPDEFELFREIICRTASEYPDILGVLVTGSLVQRVLLPKPTGEPISSPSPEHAAYQKMVSRSRRKLFAHNDADLDIWLLTQDAPGTGDLRQTLDAKAIALLKWYAQHGDNDVEKWIARKHEAFDAYYKKDEFYPQSWVASSPLPHYASGFREGVVDRIGVNLQDFRSRVKVHLRKKYPADFLELRAFPMALFNLRPEKIALESGRLDRTPFAYYLKDWLDLEQNCIVLYTKKDTKDLIYPFDPSGRVPGQALADTIGWKHTDINYTLFRDRDCF